MTDDDGCDRTGEIGQTTRDAQRAYFRTRAKADLAASKRLEKQLDVAIDEILGTAAFEAGGQEWVDWNMNMLNFGD